MQVREAEHWDGGGQGWRNLPCGVCAVPEDCSVGAELLVRWEPECCGGESREIPGWQGRKAAQFPAPLRLQYASINARGCWN